MNIDDLKKSNFLKRSDVNPAVLVTIAGAESINVAKDGAPEEMRRCLRFQELEKPMVMNSTNGEIIARITGSRDDDNWAGHKIVLYDDPNISFQGKLTGGIRARAPKMAAAPKPSHGAGHKPLDRADDPKPIGSFMPKETASADASGVEGDEPF